MKRTMTGFLFLAALIAASSGPGAAVAAPGGEMLLHWNFSAPEGAFEADAAGRGHRAQLLRGTWRGNRPERVGDGVHGEDTGALRLVAGSRLVSLPPLDIPGEWTLSFWMKDFRAAPDMPAAFSPGEVVSLETAPIGLDRPWHFRRDRRDEGLAAGWAADTGDEGWEPVHVPAFLSETPIGNYLGYGWYRTSFFVSEAAARAGHELHFGAVDEQAWVFLNGRLVGEHTAESTGRPPTSLWNRPFSVTVAPEHLRPGEENLLTVRTHASAGQSGIYEPVFFRLPPEERLAPDFSFLAGERLSPGGWEHVALVVAPDEVRLYLNGRPAVSAPRPETLPAGPARLEFVQRGEGKFTGLIDDVRLYATVLSDDAVAALGGSIYHPEAPWLAVYGEAMRRLVHAGALSRERAEALAALGAPDTGALIATLEAGGRIEDRVDALWALGVNGDYEATAALAANLDAAEPLLARAARDGLRRLYGDGVFPGVLAARGDAGAARLLGTVLRSAPDQDLQAASLEALAGFDPAHSRDILSDTVAGGNWWTRRLAARLLHGMGLETDPVLAGEADGWPMWQGDPARGAVTPRPLPEELHLQWVRELPAPRRAWHRQYDDLGKLDFDVSWAPVASGDLVFVPSSVTDSVTAYHLDDGTETWRFHAGGPVRLAPAVYRGRVYFVSDDGYLYCLRAQCGTLEWKFRGGPDDRHLLGNERVVNLWVARGAPVALDGTVYFAAGIWPLHGIFIWALEAETGRVLWVNDTTSSDYVELPHGGADGYGGIAPQGYLAADERHLVVAGGRTNELVLDRRTGAVLHYDAREGGKGSGGYAVHAVDGGGRGMKRNRMLSDRVRALSGQVEGRVFYSLPAPGERLVLTTECGRVYCFGPEKAEPVRHRYHPEPPVPPAGKWAETAAGLLAGLGERHGYALVLGAGSGDLARALIAESEMHVVVVEADPAKVRALRGELVAAGLHGTRAAVIESAPADFTAQPYLFSVVATEDAAAAGLAVRQAPGSFRAWLGGLFRRRPLRAETGLLAGTLELLRPYGGTAWLGTPGGEAPVLAAAAQAAAVDRVRVEARRGHLFAQRSGPLSGAGEWTHQYHDSANTLLSRERNVRLPLGLLWYGGPNHDNILPRHSGGPRPQVVAGRQVFLGVETIAARCVYTGRALWERDFPGIGHPFTNLELEEQWRDGDSVYMTNIPGATYIGSPFVTLPDAVYLRYRGRVHVLDPSDGRTRAEFPLPGRPVGELYGPDAPDWGHISVRGDFLVTTAEPHLFEDQDLGWTNSYSGTSSRLLAVMDRHDGRLLWQRPARAGFRHMAIVSGPEALYVIDGLSENALEHLARRGREPEEPSAVLALALSDGRERWRAESGVFGTFLLYAEEHGILVEGGSQDLRRRLADEPREVAARRAADGALLWEGGRFTLPAAVHGEMLIPGRPGDALSLLTGERMFHRREDADEEVRWRYERRYGCNTLNASENLLLFRSGYAGYYDLEHDTGTGNLSGFRAGCTANMIAADGVLNALDYTRTCTCSYANQTSLALVHMPGDEHIEFWTRYHSAPRNALRHGVNYGAPGRRLDERSGVVWHAEEGTARRHPSAVSADGAPAWVAASLRELNGGGVLAIEELPAGRYTVRLCFADLDPEAAPGRRVFDVFLNGERVLAGFDVCRAAGGPLRGVVEEFGVTVENGRLEIGLHPVGETLDPVISGVEVIAAGR